VGAALLLGRLPVLRSLENRLVDLRFLVTPLSAPDPRIVVVTIDDEALASHPDRTLGERATEVAGLVTGLFDAGVAGVGFDIMLPEKWGRSPAFASMIARHSQRLVLASFSTQDGQLSGPEVVKGLTSVALGEQGAANLFGFVNVLEDGDGRVRRMRSVFIDRKGRTVPSLAGRAAEIVAGADGVQKLSPDPLWIDHSVDWRQWPRVSWVDLPEVLSDESAAPKSLNGRFVIIGTAFAASGDIHSVPHPVGLPGKLPGVTLQAVMLSTILEGRPVRELGSFVTALLAAPIALLVVVVALGRARSRAAVVATTLAALVMGASSFLLFGLAKVILPMVAPILALVIAVIISLFARRWLPAYPEPLAHPHRGFNGTG
jgi:CHASE2 domain-containing sensor protein